ncbi:MAG: thioredoxin [Planctomycetes bacterium]|nr:thioredoxin [Planctomycetota bacterium]
MHNKAVDSSSQLARHKENDAMTTQTQHQNMLTLDADNFEREVLQSEQPVLVDFWADWCPPCKAIGPVIEEIATEFEGIARVGKVDVDENESLAERYAISSIPTLLFFRNGEVVDRVQGVVPKSDLTAKLTALSERTTIQK